MFHKTKYVLGFHVEATDGGIGHVDDFLVDQTWNVRYLVVDTSNWIGGDSVLVPSAAIEWVRRFCKKNEFAPVTMNVGRLPHLGGPKASS
jgi:hypothetical protein